MLITAMARLLTDMPFSVSDIIPEYWKMREEIDNLYEQLNQA